VSESESSSEESLARAELFEALGHPIRVKILKSLEQGGLGFSELKRKSGVKSNGHLEFHLGKLRGLVSTTEAGDYVLTDDGMEALRFLRVKTPEFAGTSEMKPLNLRNAAVAALIVGLLVSGSVIIVVGFLLSGQTSWEWSGSTECCIGPGAYNKTIPAGGVFDGGFYGTDPSMLTSRVIAVWGTQQFSGQLVFAVLDIPGGMNITEAASTLNNSLILARSDGVGDFAYLTYTLPSANYAADFVLINPTSSPMTLANLAITRESLYNPYGQTGWNLVFLGGVLLGLCVVSFGVAFSRPSLGRRPKRQTGWS